MKTKTEKEKLELIEEKLEFIDAAQDVIDSAIEPIIEERMKVYHKQFGAFTHVDVRLWSSCRIAYIVAFRASMEMDVDVDGD